jgi:2-oxoacid:acceptor oxidoreductase delta subunit (pyruvate/2-ketoisovalerate family)
MKGYRTCKAAPANRLLPQEDFASLTLEELGEQAVQEAARCLGSLFCDACDLCILLCPDLCITRDKGGFIAIDLDYCKGCGVCAAICPKSAIEMIPEGGKPAV